MGSAPAGSQLRGVSAARLSRGSTGDSASAASPTGMLMKKIHRQPGPSTCGPPISHAVVAPIPPSAPQIPSVLVRPAPSGKVVEMIDGAVGDMIAAPAPWTTRAPPPPPRAPPPPPRTDPPLQN